MCTAKNEVGALLAGRGGWIGGYGNSANDAMGKAEALAIRALAEQIEHGESAPQTVTI